MVLEEDAAHQVDNSKNESNSEWIWHVSRNTLDIPYAKITLINLEYRKKWKAQDPEVERYQDG